MAAAGSSDRWHTGENPSRTMIFFFTRNVHVWDVDSQKLVYKLPGHLGSVNDVDFHRCRFKLLCWMKLRGGSIKFTPFDIIWLSCNLSFSSVEPIILSVGSDKNIYLGEFEP